MSTPFLIFFYFLFYPGIYVPAVSRRIPSPALLSAVSGHLSSRIYFSEKVAQAVSLQSHAPQPLMST